MADPSNDVPRNAAQDSRPAKMDSQELNVACLYIQDHQRLIAAGKIQRWDVVKWAVTVNLALASASAFVIYRSGSDNVPVNKIGIFFATLSIAVAIIGRRLVLHYNTRMAGARDAGAAIARRIQARGIDVRELTGDPLEYPHSESYDAKELCIFNGVLALSVVPAIILWLLAVHWIG